MRKEKTFDCIAIKDAIQAKHVEDYACLTPEERWQLVEKELAESDDAIARKWRRLSERNMPFTKSQMHGD